MKKLLAAIIAATFAVVSVGAIAAKHGDGMKDEKKVQKKDDKKSKAKKADKKKDDKK